MLLEAAKGELMESFLFVFFSGGVIYSLEKLQGGFSGFITHVWHEENIPSSPTAYSMEETALFYGGSERGFHRAHQELLLRQRDQPFVLETLSEEGNYISNQPQPHSYFVLVVVTTQLSHFGFLRHI